MGSLQTWCPGKLFIVFVFECWTLASLCVYRNLICSQEKQYFLQEGLSLKVKENLSAVCLRFQHKKGERPLLLWASTDNMKWFLLMLLFKKETKSLPSLWKVVSWGKKLLVLLNFTDIHSTGLSFCEFFLSVACKSIEAKVVSPFVFVLGLAHYKPHCLIIDNKKWMKLPSVYYNHRKMQDIRYISYIHFIWISVMIMYITPQVFFEHKRK